MVKNLPVVREMWVASILGWGRSSGEGNGNPFQYSCLGNPMDRGAWWASVHGIAKESDMTEQLNNNKTCIILLGSRRKAHVFFRTVLRDKPYCCPLFLEEEIG